MDVWTIWIRMPDKLSDEYWEIQSQILEIKGRQFRAQEARDWESFQHYNEQLRMLEELKKELA